MEFKDYYRILGVDRNADQKTISQAFRRLASKAHPDVNKSQGAEERFKEINEAYQVLGDPQKRAQYDQIYDAYQNGGPWQDLFDRVARGPRGWTTGPGGVTTYEVTPEEFEQLFGGTFGGGFSDFFEQLFGGLGGVGGFGRPRQGGGRGRGAGVAEAQPARGTDAAPRLESAIEISLEDAYRGGRRQIHLPETGIRLDVEIPKGVRSGQVIRLPGAVRGQDLYLRVTVAPHPRFERDGDDLTVEVPISISDAALGAEIEVPTMDGSVRMIVPAGTQTGARFRLKGLGMPHARGGGRGDLYVRVRVVTPTGLSARERRLFEELREAQRERSRGPSGAGGAAESAR